LNRTIRRRFYGHGVFFKNQIRLLEGISFIYTIQYKNLGRTPTILCRHFASLSFIFSFYSRFKNLAYYYCLFFLSPSPAIFCHMPYATFLTCAIVTEFPSILQDPRFWLVITIQYKRRKLITVILQFGFWILKPVWIFSIVDFHFTILLQFLRL